MRPGSSDSGQATVEFALVLPAVVALVGCIIGITALCLDVLALNDTARTSARLASVSIDPVTTAREYVATTHPGITVHAVTDGTTVTVSLQRRIPVRIPFVGVLRVSVPLVAVSTMAIEPPAVAPATGTSVTP